jgi:predicted transcriptional regulator
MTMNLKMKEDSNINFRLSNNIKARAEALAKANNTTFSELMRYAIKSLLEKSNA